MNFDWLLITTSISVIGCLLLVGIVLNRKRIETIHVLFSFLATSIAAWTVTTYASLVVSAVWLKHFVPVVMILGNLIAFSLILFSHYFYYKKINYILVAGCAALLLFTSILAIKGLLFSDIIEHENYYEILPGPGIVPYLGITSIVFVLSHVYIVRGVFQAVEIEKKQRMTIALGTIGAITAMFVINGVITNIVKTTAFIPYGILCGLIFVLITFYAIIRLRSFETKLRIRRQILSVIGTATLGAIIVILVFAFIAPQGATDFIALLLIVVLAVFGVFMLVDKIVRSVLTADSIRLYAITKEEDEKYFRLNSFDEAYRTASRKLNGLSEEHFDFFLLNYYEGCYELLDREARPVERFDSHGSLLADLLQLHAPVNIQQILWKTLKAYMTKHDYFYVIPLFFNGRHLGAIFLKDGVNLKVVSSEDHAFLGDLAWSYLQLDYVLKKNLS